ncbi:MAG: ankyrin repeat domain-containing protein, partial [Betaproteobacteria bacterium]|nr:ankyrin repeat domain-containing protein [Betaproteobacteria bacterium]
MKAVKGMFWILLPLVLAVSFLAQPARAELPDPVRFGVRMELGDVAQAREWLDAGLPPDFVGDRIGTGLMIAAWEGNIALMELFVARGADVNKTNAAGEQALLHAAWRGKLDAVKWLLAHGARLNRGPLQWSALHYAVFAGYEEVAEYLIGRGADINARSTNGSSVLMMAAYEGREELARKLVA